MKRKLLESILFNYFGTIAAALGPLLALPVYLAALGKTQWGLVSVVTSVVLLLTMMEGGLAQVLVREFALLARRHGGPSKEVRSLLLGSQYLYGLAGLLLACGLALSSGWIATHWLNLTSDTDPHEVARLLMLGALLVAIQFFAALPRSLLLALHLHRPLNVAIAMAHVLRYGLGALVAWQLQSVQWLLIWYVTVAVAECLVRYVMAWRAIDLPAQGERVNWSSIQELGPGAAKMSLAVVLSGLTTQMDKLILFKLVEVDQVGFYAIASSVALGVLSFTYPLIQAVFPTLLSFRDDKRRMRKFFMVWLASATACAALAMTLYIWLGHAMLRLWLRNDEAASVVYPVLLVLLIGTMLNVIYQVGYVGWMLDANYKMPLIISSSSVVLTTLLTPPLVMHYGIMGAATGWLLINALGLLISCSRLRKIG